MWTLDFVFFLFFIFIGTNLYINVYESTTTTSPHHVKYWLLLFPIKLFQSIQDAIINQKKKSNKKDNFSCRFFYWREENHNAHMGMKTFTMENARN